MLPTTSRSPIGILQIIEHIANLVSANWGLVLGVIASISAWISTTWDPWYEWYHLCIIVTATFSVACLVISCMFFYFWNQRNRVQQKYFWGGLAWIIAFIAFLYFWISPAVSWFLDIRDHDAFVIVVTEGQKAVSPNDVFYSYLRQLRQDFSQVETLPQTGGLNRIKVFVETKNVPEDLTTIQNRLNVMRNNRRLKGTIWFQYQKGQQEGKYRISHVVVEQDPLPAGPSEWRFPTTFNEVGLKDRICYASLLYMGLVYGTETDDKDLMGRSQRVWDLLYNHMGVPLAWQAIKNKEVLREVVSLDPRFYYALLDAGFRLNRTDILQQQIEVEENKELTLGEIGQKRILEWEKMLGVPWTPMPPNPNVLSCPPIVAYSEILVTRTLLSLGRLDEAMQHLDLLRRVKDLPQDKRKDLSPRILAEIYQLDGEYSLYFARNFEQAEAKFGEATKTYVEAGMPSAKPLLGLGQIALKNGNVQVAQEKLKAASEIINNTEHCSVRADAYYWLSLAYYSTPGQEEKAKEATKQGRDSDNKCRFMGGAILFMDPVVVFPLSSSVKEKGIPYMPVEVAILEVPDRDVRYELILEDLAAIGSERIVVSAPLKLMEQKMYSANLDMRRIQTKLEAEYISDRFQLNLGKWFLLSVVVSSPDSGPTFPTGLPMRSIPLRVTDNSPIELQVEVEPDIVRAGQPITVTASLKVGQSALRNSDELTLTVQSVSPSMKPSKPVGMSQTFRMGEFSTSLTNTLEFGEYSLVVQAFRKEDTKLVKEIKQKYQVLSDDKPCMPPVTYSLVQTIPVIGKIPFSPSSLSPLGVFTDTLPITGTSRLISVTHEIGSATVLCLVSSEDGKNLKPGGSEDLTLKDSAGSLKVDDRLELWVEHSDGSVGYWRHDFYRPDAHGPGIPGIAAFRPEDITRFFVRAPHRNSIRARLTDLFANYYGALSVWIFVYEPLSP